VKVLIVSQYFWPENFRINDLATELSLRGEDVTVLTGWPNYPDGKVFSEFRADPGQYGNLNGVRVVRVPLVARGHGAFRLSINYLSFVFSASLIGSVKLIGEKYDVIFVYGPSPVTICLPAIVLKYMKGAPLVFWVLDLWPETLMAVKAIKSRFIIGMIGVLVRFIYYHCDLVLAQSNAFVRGIRKYCSDKLPIGYFPSWSEDLFNHIPAALATELAKKEGTFNVLFAGNIGEAQDFPTILAAADTLRGRKDIRWIIVGDGRMSGWVREEIEKRRLQENVVMTGRYPLERMPSFFAHADALLVSLRADDIFAMTIPGKVQTYLSSGLPVIGALDGEGAAVIRDAGAGYTVAAGDAKGLAAVVSRMADLSPKERNAMGTSGKLFCKKQFDKNGLIDKLEDYFADVRRRVAKGM
jgi:colanic acid biosynthesis glycosyl transferase WcaI